MRLFTVEDKEGALIMVTTSRVARSRMIRDWEAKELWGEEKQARKLPPVPNTYFAREYECKRLDSVDMYPQEETDYAYDHEAYNQRARHGGLRGVNL
jgi:hypothetical protein